MSQILSESFEYLPWTEPLQIKGRMKRLWSKEAEKKVTEWLRAQSLSILVCWFESLLCVSVCIVSILDAQWRASLSIEHTSLEEVGYSVVSHVDGGVR